MFHNHTTSKKLFAFWVMTNSSTTEQNERNLELSFMLDQHLVSFVLNELALRLAYKRVSRGDNTYFTLMPDFGLDKFGIHLTSRYVTVCFVSVC